MDETEGLIGLTVKLDLPIIRNRIEEILREILRDKAGANARIHFGSPTITVLCDRDDSEAVNYIKLFAARVKRT